jgi:Cys-tRNA synthase (O-phospho-L-seryl-tRNA:Cys-tRNA synthase)
MHFHICKQAENWTLQKVDQEYLVSSEVSCWRRMENISWTNHVKNEVLHTKEKIEGKTEVSGRRGRRCNLLLDELKERRILEIERGSTTWHCMQNSLWKRLWTCHKTDYGINDTSRRNIEKEQMMRTYSRTT